MLQLSEQHILHAYKARRISAFSLESVPQEFTDSFHDHYVEQLIVSGLWRIADQVLASLFEISMAAPSLD
jgi:hypothetical protein